MGLPDSSASHLYLLDPGRRWLFSNPRLPRGSVLPCLASLQRLLCCQQWLQTGKMGGGREMMENTAGGSVCARDICMGHRIYEISGLWTWSLCLGIYQSGETLGTMGCLLTVGRKWGRTGQEHQQPPRGPGPAPEAKRISSASPGSLEQKLLPQLDHHCSPEKFAEIP